MDLKETQWKFSLIIFLSILSSSNCNNNGTAVNNNLASEKQRFLCWLPVPIKSHQKFLEPLLRELTARGHHVTLVTPFPLNDAPTDLEQVIIQDQYSILAKALKYQAWYQQINSKMMRVISSYVESIFEDPIVRTFLQEDHKFDIILMESMILNEAFIGLHHKYRAPVVEFIPLPTYHWAFYLLGIPYDTSYIVDAVVPYTDRMTFLERLHNTAMSIFTRAGGELYVLNSAQETMDKYLTYPGWEDRPSLRAMIKNISLVLINSHFSLSYPYPLPPHVKEIGGINMNPVKPLPKDLRDFMDSAMDGVIVFSFGSHINMDKILGPEKIELFKFVFSKLEQKVLWKYDSDMNDLPSNVKITKWFPQTDVLAHKNCKLFISHCGYHSSIEAIYNRVPVVAIPIQSDQWRNAKMLTYFGMAHTLYLDNITEQSLSWIVKEVLNNKIYLENAVKRSMIYRDMKDTPLETALYWIEYVIRHKGAHHLKPAVISMPWYQQALLDVYFVLVVLALMPFVTVYVIFKSICYCCYRQNIIRKIVNKNKKD